MGGLSSFYADVILKLINNFFLKIKMAFTRHPKEIMGYVTL